MICKHQAGTNRWRPACSQEAEVADALIRRQLGRETTLVGGLFDIAVHEMDYTGHGVWGGVMTMHCNALEFLRCRAWHHNRVIIWFANRSEQCLEFLEDSLGMQSYDDVCE